KGHGQGEPDEAPDQGLFYGDFVGLAMKNAEVQRDGHKYECDEGDPVKRCVHLPVSSSRSKEPISLGSAAAGPERKTDHCNRPKTHFEDRLSVEFRFVNSIRRVCPAEILTGTSQRRRASPAAAVSASVLSQ